jgi:hypothetical protein
MPRVVLDGREYSTKRVGFALVGDDGAKIEAGITQQLDKKNAVVVDLEVLTPEERSTLFASFVREEKLPIEWRKNGFKGVRLVVTGVAAHTEDKYEYKSFADVLAVGGSITLMLADGSELKLGVSHYSVDGSKGWEDAGSGMESKMMGGKANDISAELRKKMEIAGVDATLIAGGRYSTYKTDGEKSHDGVAIKGGVALQISGGELEVVGNVGNDINSFKVKYTRSGGEVFYLDIGEDYSVIGFSKEFNAFSGIATPNQTLLPREKINIEEIVRDSIVGKEIHAIQPGDIERVVGEVRKEVFRVEAVAAAGNITADTLAVTDTTNGGNNVSINQANERVVSTITDTNGDGINDANTAAFSNPANYTAEYKPVGPGAWNPLPVNSVTFNQATGALEVNVDTQGGPAAGNLFRITYTPDASNITATTF